MGKISFRKIFVMITPLIIVGFVVLCFSKKNGNGKKTEVVHLPQEQTLVIEKKIETQEPRFEKEILPSPVLSKPIQLESISQDSDLPENKNRMAQLFQPYPPILPFIETVSYSTKVPFVTGRQAYLGDYASHYKTSKHFISRSLHGKTNYFLEKVRLGDRFNVLKMDKEIEFHCIADLSRLKLWIYAYDKNEDRRYLLKTYPICAGKIDFQSPSGCLTPTGVFAVGKDVAVYKEGVMGNWRNEPKEMISIFGVRWIPFAKELSDCSGSCKGLGFHGVPWRKNEQGQYVECPDCISQYSSEGCIRFRTEDIEEIYSLLTSRPSFVHIVRDFTLAKLPGKDT